MNLSCNYSISDLQRDFNIPGSVIDTRAIIEEAAISLLSKCCDHFGCLPKDFHSKTRRREVVLSRQMFMHCLYLSTNLSLAQVGERAGGKDHATVLHSMRTINNLLATDKQFRKDFENTFLPMIESLKLRVPQRVKVERIFMNS